MISQQMAMMNGHRFAALCAQSHYSAQNAVSEAIDAYSPIRFLHDFSKNFPERIDGFTALAKRVLSQAVCTARMTLSLTEDSRTDIAGLVAKLPAGSPVAPAAAYTTALPKKLGIRIPAQVSYACAGYHLHACGETYRGTLRLLSNILSLSCLWNSVRVQGGAYGAGMQGGRSGSLFCYSYRDPSPARTLGVYRTLAEFIQAFRNSGEDLSKFIISTIAGTEPLASPKQQGAIADQLWFAGLTYEEMAGERRELLRATWEDLLLWCDMLRAMAQSAAVCVVGNSDALAACEKEELTVVDI
jgi:Zn-dependent M16 (insulinase) family peptidase